MASAFAENRIKKHPHYESLDYGEDALEEDLEESLPQIKHCTLGNDLSEILLKDSVASMAVHTKFLVVGTYWGSIFILDHLGNKIRSKEICPHSTTVNHISVEPSGEYIASCSDDGRVVITGLYSNEEDQIFSFDRPVRAVALSPNFTAPRSKRQFVMGDDRLMMASKGLLEVFVKKPKTEVLHCGEGPIRNIQWCGDFIAWSNDLGVKVYDTSEKTRITYVRRPPEDMGLRSEIHRCSICWCDDKTSFLIAWGSRVQLVRIKQNHSGARVHGLPSRCAEIVLSFNYDTDYICGITNFKENTMILCYPKPTPSEPVDEEHPQDPSPGLRLVLIKADHSSFEEIYSYPLPLRGTSPEVFRGRYDLFQLTSLLSENIHFVLSPSEMASIHPTDLDDNVRWLIERGRFEKAMSIAERSGRQLKSFDKTKIGKTYIEYLLLRAKYSAVANLAPSVLVNDKAGWQELVDRFYHGGYLLSLADKLPYGPSTHVTTEGPYTEDVKLDVVLDSLYYELVLNDCIRFDAGLLLKLLKQWPSDIYDRDTILNALTSRLKHCSDAEPSIQPLKLCLAKLHEFVGQFMEATTLYLKMNHEEAFDLIIAHDLYAFVMQRGLVADLIQLDTNKAVKLFLDQIDRCPTEKIVRQLTAHPDLLFEYLHQLFKRDANLSRPYHTRLIELLAMRYKTTQDARQLLHFLKNTDSYDLQNALKICTGEDITPARVYLLLRVGRSRDALRLIIERQQDLEEAINFCRESGDRELWDDLIDLCLDSSRREEFVGQLLREAGMDADPRQLIRKIKPGLRIPKLRDAIVKLLLDYHVQIALREGYNQIVKKDWHNLLQKQINVQRRAISINSPDQKCPACSEVILSKRNSSTTVLFYCSHAFHQHCLIGSEDNTGRMSCPVCSDIR